MGLDFEVTPDVLIPNPDTELLVLRAVAIARESSRAVRVADVGTGSGCIAIAVAHYARNTEVWASDISAAAVDVAARNVAKHGVGERVHLHVGDMLEPLDGHFDLICANLPYVNAAIALPAEVTAQPASALFADDGGAALVRRFLDEAPAKLTPGGRILAEVDPSFVEAVAPSQSRVHRDLGGHARVLEAWFSIPTNSESSA
jgi:release factor glutamine methyltransferase